jgi:hypothetical protein
MAGKFQQILIGATRVAMGCESVICGNRRQTRAKSRARALNRLKARLVAGPQRLVQCPAGNTGSLSD